MYFAFYQAMLSWLSIIVAKNSNIHLIPILRLRLIWFTFCCLFLTLSVYQVGFTYMFNDNESKDF